MPPLEEYDGGHIVEFGWGLFQEFGGAAVSYVFGRWAEIRIFYLGWRTRGCECGPDRSEVSVGELSYLRHMRSCAACVCGCRGTGGRGTCAVEIYVKRLGAGLEVGRGWQIIHGMVECLGRAMCVVPALGPVLFSACAINNVSRGCISLLDVCACFMGSPVYNMAILTLLGDTGVRWWIGVGVAVLLAVGWHMEDVDLGRGKFIPGCELVSCVVGVALGGNDLCRACLFGVVAMGEAPFGREGRGRVASGGPSPGRVRRRVNFMEGAGGLGMDMSLTSRAVPDPGSGGGRDGGVAVSGVFFACQHVACRLFGARNGDGGRCQACHQERQLVGGGRPVGGGHIQRAGHVKNSAS